MQAELDRLRAQTPNPVTTGIRAHLAALPGPLSALAALL
jgi:hypothetical protein